MRATLTCSCMICKKKKLIFCRNLPQTQAMSASCSQHNWRAKVLFCSCQRGHIQLTSISQTTAWTKLLVNVFNFVIIDTETSPFTDRIAVWKEAHSAISDGSTFKTVFSTSLKRGYTPAPFKTPSLFLFLLFMFCFLNIGYIQILRQINANQNQPSSL